MKPALSVGNAGVAARGSHGLQAVINKLATVPGEASGVELISGPRLAGSPGEGRRSRSRAAIFRVGRRQRGLRGRLRPRLDVRGQRGARHLGHGGGGPGAARLNTSGFASMSSVLCAPAGAAAPTCSTRTAAPQSCKRSSSTRPTSSPLHDNSPPPPQADGAAAPGTPRRPGRVRHHQRDLPPPQPGSAPPAGYLDSSRRGGPSLLSPRPNHHPPGQRPHATSAQTFGQIAPAAHRCRRPSGPARRPHAARHRSPCYERQRLQKRPRPSPRIADVIRADATG